MSLELRNISKGFKVADTQVPVLRNVNITLNAGQATAILGKNGSGKSTLQNIMGGLLAADSGEIFYEGEQIFRTGGQTKVLGGKYKKS
jgi:ABC-type sugar transport system ATPase subunit